MPAIVKKCTDTIPQGQFSSAKDEIIGSLNETSPLNESRCQSGKRLSLEDLDMFIFEIETFKKW